MSRSWQRQGLGKQRRRLESLNRQHGKEGYPEPGTQTPEEETQQEARTPWLVPRPQEGAPASWCWGSGAGVWEWVVDDEAVSVGKTANCIQPLLQGGPAAAGVEKCRWNEAYGEHTGARRCPPFFVHPIASL